MSSILYMNTCLKNSDSVRKTTHTHSWPVQSSCGESSPTWCPACPSPCVAAQGCFPPPPSHHRAWPWRGGATPPPQPEVGSTIIIIILSSYNSSKLLCKSVKIGIWNQGLIQDFFIEEVVCDSVLKTRGVWGHAPPRKFWNLQPLRLFLVASETTYTKI